MKEILNEELVTASATTVFTGPENGNQFGYYSNCIGIDGDYIIVGAPGSGGQVFLYQISTQSLVKTLSDPNTDQDGYFGIAASICGDNILIGAQFDNAGTVQKAGQAYLFNTSGNLQCTIQSPAPKSNGLFGCSVAISQSNILIGEAAAENAHLFDERGNFLHTYSPQYKYLTHFGLSVSLLGNIAAVGSPNAESEGKVYIESTQSSDNYQQSLAIANPTLEYDRFGYDIAMAGNLLAIGAPSAGGNAGAVYVYDLQGHKKQTLTVSQSLALGLSIALSGKYLLIGDPNYSMISNQQYKQYAGAAYLYVFDGMTWNLSKTFQSSDPHSNGRFGKAVALSGERAIISEPNYNGAQIRPGKLYLFDLND